MATAHHAAATFRRTHARSGHRRDTRRPSRSVSSARLETLLRRVMDGGLASCIFGVPFLMGGRHPIGQAMLVACASISVVAWVLVGATAGEVKWRPTFAAFLLSGAALLVGLQLTPLPHGWLTTLSPGSVELLTLWNPKSESVVACGVWNRISLTPAETRAGLILLISYALLFLVTVQRVQGIEDIERILRWIALAAVAMAAFGTIQYFTSNGKFFWFHESPYSTTDTVAKGSFTNRNHFAHFLALGIGPLIWWLSSRYYRDARATSRNAMLGRHATTSGEWLTARNMIRILPWFAVVLVVVASLLSLSRGGNSSLFLAATVAAVVCARAAAAQGRLLAGMVLAGVLIIGSLNVFGKEYDKVSERLGDLSSGSLDQLDQSAERRTIWATTARAIPNFALFGSGVGSFREVFPVYDESSADNQFASHAENGPLQVALETGGLGTIMLVFGIGFCAFWCIIGLRSASSTRLNASLGAISAGLAASLVHSMVDFVWYVPGCMAVVAILAGLACRAFQLARFTDQRPRVRKLSPVVAVAVVLVGVLTSIGMIGNRVRAAVAEHYWERSRIAVAHSSAHFRTSLDTASPEYREADVTLHERLVADLEKAVAWYPEHARAHLELARCHLRLFEIHQAMAANPMPLSQIRDAAIASQDYFASRKERDAWMQRAFGDHCEHLHLALRHARRCLGLSPLLGEAYVFMAEVGFLDRAAPESKWAYFDQAIRVRPHTGAIWAAAARETLDAVNSGDLEPWLRFARKVLESGTQEQKHKFLEGPLKYVPPEGIASALEFYVAELQPDVVTLGHLYQIVRKRVVLEALRPFQTHYVAVAEAAATKSVGREAARLWSTASSIHVDLGDTSASIRCLRQAFEHDASNANTRFRLACLLLETGNAAEAQSHLRWCVRREPGNKTYERKYQEALRGANHET